MFTMFYQTSSFHSTSFLVLLTLILSSQAAPTDSKPGGLPITLLVCGIVILLVLVAIGLMLIYIRLCLGQPATAAPGMIVGPKGYLKGGPKGLKGPKGGGFKGGISDPKAGLSAQGSAYSGKSFSTRKQKMVGGKAISYEQQTLKSKRSGKKGFLKSKQSKQSFKCYVGKRSGSSTSKNSTSSAQTGKQRKKKTKSKGKHHQRKVPTDQTMLYKQSVQYYKQFLKSVHSVKSVSEYFETSRNSKNSKK